MCGIAGVVGPDAHLSVSVIRGMNHVQRHRGPDGNGVFVSDDVALGSVRLAIVDPTPVGEQPMSTENERFTIVHNGEVFNYVELREELKGAAQFRSQTDTEVILRAFEKWGPACVDRLVGMFSFAIWDRKERSLFCARDRFGVKPFYYVLHQGCVWFASEIKSLLAAGVPRVPRVSVIREYLSKGIYDHGTDTFFEGIQSLAPGCSLLLRPDAAPVTRRYYWLPDHVDPFEPADDAAVTVRLRELLDDTIRLSLRADVKIGISLSGGLDSSVLLGLVDRVSDTPENLEGFTCIYSDERYSERRWVEIMARATQRHVTFSLLEPEDFWNALGAVSWFQDEPFGGVPNVSWVGLYLATKQRGVKVLLDGHGLDDILGGYRSHHVAYLADCSEHGSGPSFDGEFEAYLSGWGISREQGLRDVRQALLNDTVLALDATIPVRPDCLSNDLRSEASAEAAFATPFSTRVKNQMYRGLMHTKVPRTLRFLDHGSMMFSRELRVPFLDHRLVEFCFSLSDRQYIRNGLTKYALREATADVVPSEVRLAPKRSVVAPQREWLRILQPQIEELFASGSFASRGILDPARVKTAYREYCGGNMSNSFYVWQWINLEMWFRTFIDPTDLSEPSLAWRDFTVDSLTPS